MDEMRVSRRFKKSPASVFFVFSSLASLSFSGYINIHIE